MAYKIEQGIIDSYSQDNPRVCNVVQIPDHYMMTNVRLPQTLYNQIKPAIKSLVFVASEDNYKSYILSVIREPKDFVSDNKALRGGESLTSQQLAPGEIFFESRGDPSIPYPGTGATLLLSNDGTATISSGYRKEQLIIGGRDSDEDHECVLEGDNVLVRSTIKDLIGVRSTFNFDEDNNLQVANLQVITAATTTLENPISELTMDEDGNIELRNTRVVGPLVQTKSSLQLKDDGEIHLRNLNIASIQQGSLKIEPNGTITIENILGGLEIASSGNISGVGPIINFNNGTFGVARLNDTVATVSNITTDPTWWTFWSTLAAQIAALPVTPLDGGATLKAGLSTLFATIPTSISATGTITSASVTVKAGG